jgi:hypothetical protein
VIKIDQKIVGYSVLSNADSQSSNDAAPKDVSPVALVPEIPTHRTEMHEKIPRPECLPGFTYRIKTPLCDHALYITINDIILNPGTEHEHRRPFEIFINCKEMAHFQWIVAVTRILSAVFRKGGDCIFIIDELKSVFDPKGGYFNKGEYIPSLVAAIGGIIAKHMKTIGVVNDEEMDESTVKYLAAKKAEIKAKEAAKAANKDNMVISDDLVGDEVSDLDGLDDLAGDAGYHEGYPDYATLCSKCNHKAVVVSSGCAVCLRCADSRCS